MTKTETLQWIHEYTTLGPAVGDKVRLKGNQIGLACGAHVGIVTKVNQHPDGMLTFDIELRETMEYPSRPLPIQKARTVRYHLNNIEPVSQDTPLGQHPRNPNP
jgi:hypothetical protein